ncbi:MAG: hypothetical protein JXR23_09200 [Pontiellaceae bacterium]|nr:hypothetical protein [Pontiellaceae bacterium]
MNIILAFLVYIVFIFSFVFWLGWLIDLLSRDVNDFESQTHKLVWFIAIMVGNVIGAMWYSKWIKNEFKKAQQEKQMAINREIAECWKKGQQQEEER